MLEGTMPVFLFLARAGFKSKWGEIQPSFWVFDFFADIIIVIVTEQQLFVQCFK